MPYDKGKAEVFNRLYSQGTSKAEALRQAGIEPSSYGNYALGKNGQLGPLVAGTGKVAGVDYDKYTEEEKAEQRRFDAALKDTDYDEKPTNGVSSVTPLNYRTESTVTVSGGGSTTITAGPRQATRESAAIGDAYSAKNAEYNQFVKDNPSDFARKRQGLPPLTPEERERRDARLNELNQEKADLRQAQINAETSGQPTITTTPNTTTTTNTVTTGTSSSNSDLNIQDDPAVFQQAETQLDARSAPVGSRVSAASSETNPIYVSVQTPQGNLLFQDQAAYEAWQNDPQSVNFATTPSGQLVQVAPANENVEVTELAEPVDTQLGLPPGADPEGEDLPELLGGPDEVDAGDDPGLQEPPAEDEEPDTPQLLGGPEEVDTAEDTGLKTPDGEEEGGEAADTGLREPTDEDVEQAVQENAIRERAKQQATFQARYKQPGNQDWRVRLSLSPNANYLYNAGTPRGSGAGILAPLAKTDGVIFPYTPTISTTYSANYEQYDLVHSNYRGVFYKNSRVGDINIRGTFTAQDTVEANYLLAVIHFFRSATKMFYGQDAERGTPPPVCLLNGLGQYQFSDHPVVITSFNYNTPNDVDYIRADNPNNYGDNLLNRRAPVATNPGGTSIAGLNRLLNAVQNGLSKGALPNVPAPGAVAQTVNNTAGATYVPTKMEIDITLIPVQTRSQISKQFSLKGFANGQLLKGGFW